MMEDIRNHDTRPTREESAWMAFEGGSMLLRAIALAALALVIGWSASALLAETPAPTAVAKLTAR